MLAYFKNKQVVIFKGVFYQTVLAKSLLQRTKLALPH
jgi:hypothetical protein